MDKRISLGNRFGNASIRLVFGVTLLLSVVAGATVLSIVLPARLDAALEQKLGQQMLPSLLQRISSLGQKAQSELAAKKADSLERARNAFGREKTALANALAATLLPMAENFDLEAIEAVVGATLTENPALDGVRIRTQEGDPWKDFGNPGAEGTLSYDVRKKSEFGFVEAEMSFSTKGLDAELRDEEASYAAIVSNIETSSTAINHNTRQDVLVLKDALSGQIRVLIALAAAVAAIGVVMMVLILLARIVTKPLGGEPRSMALLADSVAEGKLATDSGEATTCHGAYGSMLRMKARLREIVAGVTAAGNEVAATAERIASSSTGLAVRTESQAASLEQTAASLEQMTSTVQQSAENSAQASQLAKAAGDEAEHGGEVAAKAVEAMNTISHASRKIGDIISVIDSIAFQTNLLALNAAVEAARAGDQGRGFAVVAGEVRTLAQRSAQAADEIKVLITDTVNKVEDGSRLVNESGAALEMIVESVKKVSAFSTEIASASQEQALGIDQISTAVTQMDQSTQQNAALVEQTTTASAALGRQAQELSRLMEFFDTGDANGAAATEGGKNRCVMPPPASQAQPEKPKVVLVKSDRESTAGNCRGQLHFDFSSARSKHLAWKPRLRGFLDGNGDLTEAEAISHRDCDFGKWLYARGLKDFGHLRQMQELERIHEQMHRQVKILVQAKNAGDTKRANVILDEVGKLSERVVELLHIVEHETTQEREAPATRRLAAGGESWEAF